MHEELFKTVETAILNGKTDFISRAAPRGNAKSTIVSLALPIWVACYKHKKYTLLISDSSDQANDFLRNIREEFEDNEKIFEDFGELEGLVWSDNNIILANDVRIQALGAGKKVRGRKYRQHRPDLIIVDDIENDENIASPDQRKKNEMWYFRAVSKSGDKNTDIIAIGTLLHYDSLLSKLLKNPIYDTKKYQSVYQWSKSDKWNEWERIITDLENPNHIKDAEEFFNANREEMLEGTLVVWSEKEDYYNLMLQRIVDGPAAFSSEKQNEPLSDDERRFLLEWIRYYEDDEVVGKTLFVVGACDPSMGKKGGDYSAIITLGMDSNGIVYILDVDITRRHPDIIVADVISKHRTFDYKIFGVEENQFQEYFKDTLKNKVEEMQGKPLSIRGIRSHSDKVLRIQSLQPDIKSGRVRFKRDQQKLIEQLVNFPSADHDDGPDALEIALSLLTRKSAVGEYYKDKANENAQQNPISFLQNPNLQGIIR